MAQDAVAEKSVPINLACAAFGISESCYRYEAKLACENDEIADWLIRLTDNHRNWGFGLPCAGTEPSDPAQEAYGQGEAGCAWGATGLERGVVDGFHGRPAQRWRSVRVFNVIDDFNREALAIDVDFSLPALRVIRSLDQVIEWRGQPAAIRCDNGPEYISGALLGWAEKRGVRIDFIQPGKPQQNAYVERFNRTVRYEWLAQYEFDRLSDMQDYATSWMWSYNHDRPNMALGGITPKQRLAMAA